MSGALRIIPARAGFTATRSTDPSTTADHPRSRGVYHFSFPLSSVAVGSSPLARGLLLDRHGDVGLGGIIPARAGFTTPRRREHPISPDHPRSRGVYSLSVVSDCPRVGSSPLARGLLGRAGRERRGLRIIPARAGFTSWRRTSWTPRSDHPRSRGVYAVRPSEVVAVTDHPRSRGVYSALLAQTSVSVGSSPLARGLPLDHAKIPLLTRIIPARAGFTAVRSNL